MVSKILVLLFCFPVITKFRGKHGKPDIKMGSPPPHLLHRANHCDPVTTARTINWICNLKHHSDTG